MTEFRIVWIEQEDQWCMNIYEDGKFKDLQYFKTTTAMTNYIYNWKAQLIKGA